METDPNYPNIISDIITRTERISYADNRLELPTSHIPSQSFEFNLIGKIISSRGFNSTAIQEITTKAWNPKGAFKVSGVARNVFVFAFEQGPDLKMAFNKRPWTIKGAHLILKEWNPELSWEEVDFSRSSFWVQAHGLPSSWKNQECLAKVGNETGIFKETDHTRDTTFHWRRFSRIRVDIDIQKALLPKV